MDRINTPIETKYDKIVEQYIEQLEKYQKSLNNEHLTVFMQVGDFYEVYGLEYNDGKTRGNIWEVCNDLNIKYNYKKTKVFDDESIKVVMGGVPVERIELFLNMAVEGWEWTVVMITQQGDDKNVTRYLENIISPGTNIYSTQSNNALMVIYLESLSDIKTPRLRKLYAGISHLDCLTGESGIIQYPSKEASSDAVIYDEILKIITIKNPSEVVIYTSKCDLTEDELVKLFHLDNRRHHIILDDIPKEYSNKANNKQEHIFNKIYGKGNGNGNGKEKKDRNIYETIGVGDLPSCRVSLALMLKYIIERNPLILSKIQLPDMMYNLNDNLILANNSIEQLNIVSIQKRTNYRQKCASMLDILDNTKTHMGKRLIRERLMNPISNHKILNERYQLIGDFINFNKKDSETSFKINNFLRNIGDIKVISRQFNCGRIKIQHIPSIHTTFLTSLDLFKYLRSNIINSKKHNKLKSLLAFLEKINGDDNKLIIQLEKLLSSITKAFDLNKCDTSIRKLEDNPFNNDYDTDINELQKTIFTEKNIIDEAQKVISAAVEEKKDKGKITVGKGQNKNNGHYIYLSPTKEKLLKEYINDKGFTDIKIGNYSLKKSDFNFSVMSRGKVQLVLECISRSGGNMINYTNRMRKLIEEKFMEWCNQTISKYYKLMLELSDYIGEIDYNYSCSKTAIQNGYICPTIDLQESSYINVKEIRHPLVEYINKDIPYIGNDIQLGKETNGVLLYGINASGKSNFMKSLGVNIIMAQAGMFVAAKTFTYSPFKYLFTRILNNDNIYAGMSSFQVEMSELKVILKYADKNSIVLGDELCHGTETTDATALVAAGVNQLSKRNCNFIFATHLHHLANNHHISSLNNVSLKHMSVLYDKTNDKITYQRKLLDGSGPSSYGIVVCRAMDMDDEFTNLAQTIRDELSDEKEKLVGKKSKYNSQKFLGNCEVCQINLAVDTHHIKFQCSANNDGMIEQWHKDSKFNLVGLCKKCHKSVHSSPSKLAINGYTETSQGIELEYNWL